MLDLSRCTLLVVETRAHEITHRVIEDCLSKALFGDVLIYTDQPTAFVDIPARIIPCEDFPNKKAAGAFYYGKAMSEVITDYALMMEWDGGIFDPTKWRDEFFEYDYIGAPWVRPKGDPQIVGNGGFTLMSTGLGQYAVANFRKLPVYTDWDFCRLQRRHYEAAGYKWPDGDLASLFSWELGPRNPDHFGFHGAFTWPEVLTKDEVILRARLMLKSKYLSVKATQLFTAAPWLAAELTTDELDIFHNNLPPGYLRPKTIPGYMSPQQRQAMMLMKAARWRGPTVLPHPQQGLKA